MKGELSNRSTWVLLDSDSDIRSVGWVIGDIGKFSFRLGNQVFTLPIKNSP